jgi:hypothetical protein
MFESFARGDYAAAPTNFQAVVLSMLLAFILGQAIAWIYMLTHSGASYSRSFVVSLVLMPVIVALVLTVLSNNLVTAFGLMAVFAIVRFRNILRDTLDTSYVLAAIVIGMACGTQKYSTAIVGCALVGLIMVYLSFSSFGSRRRYDVVLNLHWSQSPAELAPLHALLDRHSLKRFCAHRHQSPDGGADFSFRLLLRDPARSEEMIREISGLPGVSRVASMNAADESEI